MAYFEYRPHSTLYHYCSAASFDGITANGSIWLSDLQHANDPKELQLSAVIDGVISELIRDAPSASVRITYARMKTEMKRLAGRFGLYSFSLSLTSDRLPMWQEYTDRGRGYIIGFRPSSFSDMPVRVQRVKYVQPNYFGTLHSDIASIIAPLAGKAWNFLQSVEPVAQLLSLITATKDDTWRHEDEVRLIFSNLTDTNDKETRSLPIAMRKDGSSIYSRPPLLRKRDGTDIPYYSMEFGRYRTARWDASGAIAQVIVGPNNPCTIEEVEDNLREKGYHGVSVQKSRCAFRP
ncbi:DUF2971 domain-containing protein [Rhizobium sp.]|uniref:DUF2971 domain-containing protein n=1 Tax=Rhizobium sp. TaxID=391 RepID=UPI0034C6DE1E